MKRWQISTSPATDWLSRRSGQGQRQGQGQRLEQQEEGGDDYEFCGWCERVQINKFVLCVLGCTVVTAWVSSLSLTLLQIVAVVAVVVVIAQNRRTEDGWVRACLGALLGVWQRVRV